jgi:hypothetical protein
MRQLTKTLKAGTGPDGLFFITEFDVGITFGGTELKAFVQWEENVRRPMGCFGMTCHH